MERVTVAATKRSSFGDPGNVEAALQWVSETLRAASSRVRGVGV